MAVVANINQSQSCKTHRSYHGGDPDLQKRRGHIKLQFSFILYKIRSNLKDYLDKYPTHISYKVVERSQNTVLLASTQALYKTLHSTVRRQLAESSWAGDTVQLAVSSWTVHSSSSRKSQSVRLEHDTLELVVASCTYASTINASKDIQCIRCVQT